MSRVDAGVRQLPGFDESLRLLVERERYSLTDIALMFGVSRERIRQLYNKLGVQYPEATPRGLNAVRVWDDARNLFRPIAVRDFRRQATEKRVRYRRLAVAKRESSRRAAILAAVQELCDGLNRPPSWYEIWVAIGGNPDKRRGATSLVLNRWCSRGMSTAEKIADFRAATGIQRRDSGGRGHVAPRRRLSTCRRGHEWTPENTYQCANGKGVVVRYCRACTRLRQSACRRSPSPDLFHG